MRITVSTIKACPTDEFHRAGLVFGPKPKTYEVTQEQAEAIENDQMLVVKRTSLRPKE